MKYNLPMSKKTIRRGASRADWLDAGMNALTQSSVDGITIERLARSLGIAKAGFYWHFKNREEYVTKLLENWLHEVTEVVTDNTALLAMEPKSRLVAAAEIIHDNDLIRSEASILLLANKDKLAAKVVRKAIRLRLDFISSTLAELGFTGDDLSMRAMLFVCYHSTESMLFRNISRKQRRELIVRQIDLLTTP